MQPTCFTCGDPIAVKHRGPTPKTCGRRQCWPSNALPHTRIVPDEQTCSWCSNKFSRAERGGGRAEFCSDMCLRRHQTQQAKIRRQANKQQRTCRECDEPIMLGIWCAAHRSQRTRTCQHCTQSFFGSADYCSDKCRWAKNSERISIANKNRASRTKSEPIMCSQLDWTECPVCDTWVAKRGRMYCSSQCRNRAGNAKQQGIDIKRRCKTCNIEVTGLKRRLCDDCRDKSALEQRRKIRHLRKHIDRAKHFGVSWERFNPREIFERDGWRCGICKGKVDKRLDGRHPRGATLDHIIPLSWRIWEHGHTRKNTRCAHRDCNTKRGNRMSAQGEQLALVG